MLTSGPGADAVWANGSGADADEPEEAGTSAAGPDGIGAPGRAAGAPGLDGSWADLAAWPPPRAVPVEVDDLYAELSAAGYEYGPSFRGLRAAWRREGELFADIELPDGVTAAGYGVHPALLDAALHVLALRDSAAGGPFRPEGEPGGILVPFSWDGAVLHAEGASALRVAISGTATGGTATGGTATGGSGPGGEAARTVSVRCADPAGRPVFSARSLTVRPLDPVTISGAERGGDGTLLTLEWDAAADASVPVGPDAPAGDAAGLDGWAGLGDGLPAALAGVAAYRDVAALAAAVAAGEPAPAAVVACLPAPASTPRLPDRVHDAAGQALTLLQDWLACAALGGTRLIVLTRGAVAVPAVEAVTGDPAAAAIWGLVRSAQTEHPGRILLADADTGGPDTGGPDIASAALAAIHRLGAPQAIVRDGKVLVPRLARTEVLIPPSVREWRVETAGQRTLDTLTLAPCPALAAPPSEGMVRVAVHAVGVNFRDVLIALGALAPGRAGADAGAVIGSEGAGVVEAVGAGVTDLAPGDRVMALCSGMGPVAVTDHRHIVKIPPEWSFEEAAGVPVVFLTALYGL
ncbi:MAG TPA: polyketide synthase dehydratase domain-containing protein, partial [Urbifossiella sp.]|nr:polyketide synthase dehydratase domain-containing protein [Urbifossiella sp.]